MDLILSRWPSSASASVLTFTTMKRPDALAATLASSGATIRQGPHHGAQKSTTTGTAALLIRKWKSTSDSISIGAVGPVSGCLQRPQRIWFPSRS
jgi:hypothetical protein